MGFLEHHVHRAVQDSQPDGEQIRSLRWNQTLRLQRIFHQTVGLRGTTRNLQGRERDEDNKDPILGDRLHLPLQLHHREDWTGVAWGRMLNCPLGTKISCKQRHNNNPARRHRGYPIMLPAGK